METSKKRGYEEIEGQKDESDGELEPTAKRAKLGTDSMVQGDQIEGQTHTLDDPEAQHSTAPPHPYIHVNSTPEEIDQKMATFIAKKRHEVDLWNQSEFVDDAEHKAQPAARAAAAPGAKRQIKVWAVQNSDGPLVRPQADPADQRQFTHPPDPSKYPNVPPQKVQTTSDNPNAWQYDLPPGVEERLKNLEDFLTPARSVKAVPRDVYARLKKLEDKVLALEKKGAFGTTSGASKDYSQPLAPPSLPNPLTSAPPVPAEKPPVADAMDSIYSHLEEAMAQSHRPDHIDLPSQPK